MKKHTVLMDTLITAGILSIGFVIGLILQKNINLEGIIPAVFILGVFITSVVTGGYIYGFISSFVSVFAVNFAFTFPYFRLSLSVPENIFSAVIMIVIAFVTCGFTAKLKHSEMIKALGEREKMRADLLRAVSHDIRTPLTAIYGASSALIDNEKVLTDEQKRRMLTGIRDDASWLNRLMENILSITKIENGSVKIIKTETPLEELIDSVLVKFKKRYPGYKVSVALPEDFVIIPMDALLIEQVILNILDNAIVHAEGMTLLTLSVHVKGKTAVFEIADNGCGIPEEKLKSIFSGAYTSSASLDSPPSDSGRSNAGIGLSVCSTIIKAHGGEISAENRKEGGAAFKFMLDIAESGD